MGKRITDKQRKSREINPRSLENLKPFQKGESGNPATDEDTTLRAMLEQLADDTPIDALLADMRANDNALDSLIAQLAEDEKRCPMCGHVKEESGATQKL